MKKSTNLPMWRAARKLNISRQNLFAILRQRKIFKGRLPLNDFVREGFFMVDNHRVISLPGTDVEKRYSIALVTPKGMRLLNEIMKNDELEATQILSRK